MPRSPKKNDRGRVRGLQAEPLEPRWMLTGTPVISEFLARNDAGLEDGDGNTPDWIEIYNAGDQTLDLLGYHLTDDASNRQKWAFPSVQLAAHQYLLVFASGRGSAESVDSGGYLHTDFKLDQDGEYLALVSPDGSILSEFGADGEDYPGQRPNVSYGVSQSVTLVTPESSAWYWIPETEIGLRWTEPTFDIDASGFRLGSASLGFDTDIENQHSFRGLYQTELRTDAHAVYARIEFDVSDPSLVEQLTLRLQYDNGFAAYLNGVLVARDNAPESLPWYSGAIENRPDLETLEFADFSVDARTIVRGRNVLAIHVLDHAQDHSDLLLVPELVAHGTRVPRLIGDETSGVGFMPVSTPGLPNPGSDQVYVGLVDPVRISLEHGFFDRPQQVSLSTETADADIYFTTDGSVPQALNPSALRYSQSLTIDRTTPLRAAAYKRGFLPSPVVTQTYVFLDDVISQDEQSTLAAGFPDRWGVIEPDYGLDNRVIGPSGQDLFGGKYTATVRDGLRAIPTLSIVMTVDDLFGPKGIYPNATESGVAWEKPASIELIVPDGSTGFQVDAGIRISGGLSRLATWDKHSFRLLFKAIYGSTKLVYPLFGDQAAGEFDSLSLRMNAQDSWLASSNALFVRDEFARRTQLAMGQPAGHGRFVHVYLNGVYWGMYNLIERPDAGFAQSNLGVDKDNWDGLNSGTPVNAAEDPARQNRTLQTWNTLLELTADVAHATNEFERTAAYFRLQGRLPTGASDPQTASYLDVDNYIDYLILNHYISNRDWPFRNYYAGRESSPDSAGFRFFSWDADISLTGEPTFNLDLGVQVPFHNLVRSAEFRMRFADHVHRHLFNGGALWVDPGHPEWDPDHPERNPSAARFAQLTEEIFAALVPESARWGGSRPTTRDEYWISARDDLLQNLFPARTTELLELYRQNGLYPLVDAPQFNQHGGEVDLGFRLEVMNPNDDGTVYYTLDGRDPRRIGGQVDPAAIRYDGSLVPVTHAVRVNARVLLDGQWSALNDVSFSVGNFTSLQITELNYHPHDAVTSQGETAVDADEFEFIEVSNLGPSELNLSGMSFTDGVEFTFADGTLMQPSESILIVRNSQAFHSRYGDTPRVVGQYQGRLANGGELIELTDPLGNVLRRFAYDDSVDWPGAADGHGSTLELMDHGGDLNSAASWRASQVRGGSPGVLTSTRVAGDANDDGVFNASDVIQVLQASKYSTGQPASRAEGDFNGDGLFDALDIVFALAWGDFR